MDVRTSYNSFSPLYTAEGRKLQSFFMRYWLHPHIKAVTVIRESASISVRNPVWGGFTEYQLLSIHKELTLKQGSQLPWIPFICLLHIKQSHFFVVLTICNLTEVIMKVTVYFLQKIYIFSSLRIIKIRFLFSLSTKIYLSKNLYFIFR